MAEYLTGTWAEQQSLEIRQASDVGEARRMVARLTNKLPFGSVEIGNSALIATELTTNLLKHAKSGKLVMRLLQSGKSPGLEFLALDQGPGIVDVRKSMLDGYSTAGSPGNGLGAIQRLASVFDIHSIPNKGTAVLARLWSSQSARRRDTDMDLGVVCLPIAGEEVSGDSWGVDQLQDKYSYMVVDGLGHGPDAAVAAHAAVATVQEHRGKAPAEVVARAHAALRSTRGAALAVSEIDTRSNVVRFCGVGNITGSIVNPAGVRHMVSHNGVVGRESPKISEFSYPWSAESLLIMHSDGLTARWDLKNYPALLQRDPALIAGVMYRDFSRGRDDSTVLAARRSDTVDQ